MYQFLYRTFGTRPVDAFMYGLSDIYTAPALMIQEDETDLRDQSWATIQKSKQCTPEKEHPYSLNEKGRPTHTAMQECKKSCPQSDHSFIISQRENAREVSVVSPVVTTEAPFGINRKSHHCHDKEIPSTQMAEEDCTPEDQRHGTETDGLQPARTHDAQRSWVYACPVLAERQFHMFTHNNKTAYSLPHHWAPQMILSSPHVTYFLQYASMVSGYGGLGPCTFSLSFITEEEMRYYNKSYAHKDKSTNVLAFPAHDPEALSTMVEHADHKLCSNNGHAPIKSMTSIVSSALLTSERALHTPSSYTQYTNVTPPFTAHNLLSKPTEEVMDCSIAPEAKHTTPEPVQTMIDLGDILICWPVAMAECPTYKPTSYPLWWHRAWTPFTQPTHPMNCSATKKNTPHDTMTEEKQLAREGKNATQLHQKTTNELQMCQMSTKVASCYTEGTCSLRDPQDSTRSHSENRHHCSAQHNDEEDRQEKHRRITQNFHGTLGPLYPHIYHLLLHGFLHLLHFDHHTPTEAHIMESIETRVMQTWGWPAPYA